MTKYAPPRGESIARGIGHLMFMGGAIWGAFGQLPESVLESAHPMQLTIWAVFMSAGLVAAIACWVGAYLLEYAVIPFMVAGILIYIAAITTVVVTGANPGSGLALFLMISLASYLTARWLSLNQLLDGPLKLLLKRRQESDE